MAGEPIPAEPIVPVAAPEAPIVAPVVDAAPAPVVAAPEAPIVEAAPAPVVEAAPVAPPTEAKPEAPATPHPADVPTLLEKIGQKPAEAKPADVKPGDKPLEAKPGEVKPGEVKPGEPIPAAPEAPIEYKFEFPEAVRPDEAKVTAFTELAREVRMSPEQAQKAVGMFNDAATAYREEVGRQQLKAFTDTRAEWAKKVLSDPQIGGAGHQTAMTAIARARDRLTSDSNPGTPQYAADEKELNDFLRITGAGDHPAFLRLMHRAARFIDEPAAPSAQAVPTKTNGVRPGRGLYRNPPVATR